MRILIVTDAWTPQVNGVVRTLQSLTAELRRMSHDVRVFSPDQFTSLPCPTYPEIRLALVGRKTIGAMIAATRPDAIHIATEGPLGLAARRWCTKRGIPFTTAYHTQFPEYLAKRTRLPASWFWRYIRWFHAPAKSVLVSTGTMARLLKDHGLSRTSLWGRGVDLDCFHPGGSSHSALQSIPHPVQLYVGRVAVEKNIEAFLTCPSTGSKIVVGDGPALKDMKRRYPDVSFLGKLEGQALASTYAGADVFVFPSVTDTFGLVMIEALACGTPVAAFPVPGPLDILNDRVGCMDPVLERAITNALALDRTDCAVYGRSFSWKESARQFEAALVTIERLPPFGSRRSARERRLEAPV